MYVCMGSVVFYSSSKYLYVCMYECMNVWVVLYSTVPVSTCMYVCMGSVVFYSSSKYLCACMYVCMYV